VKSYKCREIFKKLRKHDARFEVLENRGKGGHKMIYHPDIDGGARSLPIPCHNGNTELNSPDYYKQIIRRFNLNEDFF
jgi:hypothetical protein